MVVLSSFQLPESPIHYEQRNTRAVLDKRDLGLGTVYISERTLSWKENGSMGFSLMYPHISLHAISSDPNVYPRECIYVMIDAHVYLPGDEPPPSPEQEDSDAESEADISELILVPADPGALTPMYDALKDCQALNPDPEDMEDDEEQIYEDADEHLEDRVFPENELNDVGAGGDTDINHITERLQNNSIQVIYDYDFGDNNSINDEQFEDAD